MRSLCLKPLRAHQVPTILISRSFQTHSSRISSASFSHPFLSSTVSEIPSLKRPFGNGCHIRVVPSHQSTRPGIVRRMKHESSHGHLDDNASQHNQSLGSLNSAPDEDKRGTGNHSHESKHHHRHHHDHSLNFDENYPAAKRITLIGIGVNIFLSALKIVVGIIGNSSVLVADAAHSLSDMVADIVALGCLRVAKAFPTPSTPLGLMRAQTFGAIAIGGLLAMAGIGVILHSWSHLAHGGSPDMAVVFAAILSIVVKEALYRATAAIGQRSNSQVLIANAWHHRSDAVSSLIALVGAGGQILGVPYLDPLAAGIIFKAAWDIVAESFQELMDSKYCEKERLLANQILKGDYSLLVQENDDASTFNRTSKQLNKINSNAETIPNLKKTTWAELAEHEKAVAAIYHLWKEYDIARDPTNHNELALPELTELMMQIVRMY